MCAALDDRGCGYQRDLCLLLELRNGQRAAVAHGGTYLAQGQAEVVLQRACVRNVGVNAFLEGQLLVAAHVVALPVAGTGRTLAFM